MLKALARQLMLVSLARSMNSYTICTFIAQILQYNNIITIKRKIMSLLMHHTRLILVDNHG